MRKQIRLDSVIKCISMLKFRRSSSGVITDQHVITVGAGGVAYLSCLADRKDDRL